jgi:1-acyl-sn-glycerol-3-phosphate acyltransferase
MSSDASTKSTNRSFLPATPSAWLINLVQAWTARNLEAHNTVHIDEGDLNILRKLPHGAGVILTPNHADEVDPRVCMELSRLSGRRFIFMGNREAFNEWCGIAGWGFQHIGVFSVERGGRDTAAKQFATDVVKAGTDVLVIFPEGEIYYLNEQVQPFHSGAVDIGVRAIVERRQVDPDWTAYVVPMAIRYSYATPLKKILENRVAKMEKEVSAARQGFELRTRLASLLTGVLQREEKHHHIEAESARFSQLTDRITHARHAILEQVQEKYTTAFSAQARTIDRAFQLSAHVRELLAQKPGPELEQAYRQDLSSLKEVAHMVSWQPQYIESELTSDERLAEMVLKLEREIYHIARPPQLAKRNVFLRVGEPVDLAQFLPDYHIDAHTVRSTVAEQLRSIIQALIDEMQTSAVTTS